MNKTRLFVYKEPTLHNPTFEYTLTTVGDYRDDWWQYPTGTVFTNGCIVPFPDTLDGDYAITQNIGISNRGGVVYLAITIDKWGVPDGMIDIGIGNAHYIINPSLYANNTFPYTIDLYELNVPLNAAIPDPDWNYYVTIRGSGGAYLAGNPVKNWGIKSIYLRGAYTENYREVDLYDNLEVPVVYNVADVRDISKKDSNFSLDFSVPNTPNNADLFDHIYEITDNASMFEILKQYPCYLEVDNNRTFDGYFKMTQVTINDNKEVSYKCNLYSNVIEFVKRLGTTTLRDNENVLNDLSFSEYTFGTVERPFNIDSWFRYTDMFTWATVPDPDEPTGEKPYGKDCYFAVVDKMAIENNSNRYDVSDPNERGINLFFDELTPFLFYKEIWDKLFQWAGFSYVSDFIENTANNKTGFEFDHLAYPAVNFDLPTLKNNYSHLTQDWISPNYDNNSQYTDNSWRFSDGPSYFGFQYPIYGDQHNTGNLGILQNNCYNGAINLTHYEFTAQQGGVYNIKVNVPWKVEAQLNNGYGSLQTQPTPFYAYCNDTTAVENSVWSISLWVEHNGVRSRVAGDEATPDWNDHTGSGTNYWNVSSSGLISDFIPERLFSDEVICYLAAGDRLFLRYYFYYKEYRSDVLLNMSFLTAGQPDAGCGLWFTMKCVPLDHTVYDTNRIVDIKRTSDFYIDGNFDPTVILNPNRKKIDFINDIIKKFNLYIEDVTDKKDDNGTYYRDYNTPNVRRSEPILRIEPRNMYYDNRATVVDWTDRVDTDSIEFKRIDDYLYKRMTFNDKNDQTYYVKDYNENNFILGEYGEKIVVSPYNTSEDEKTEVKTDLGQTMVGRPFRDYGNNYLECPHIFSLSDRGELQSDKSFSDRMLFVFNLYPGTDPYNIYPWDFNAIWNGSRLQYWRLYERYNADLNAFNEIIGTVHTMRSFCTLNHFNVPFGSDTADLNFGWAMWYYQNLNDTWAVSNNCYNQFYQRMVDDYNNVNARIMTCNCYLSPEDVRDLQLSDTVLINNVPYHINKIEQWKNGSTPTKCEFIKILENTSDLDPVFKKDKDEDKYNKPPRSNIVTPLSVQTEMTSLLASQNEIIVKMQATMKSMDERIKKLED